MTDLRVKVEALIKHALVIILEHVGPTGKLAEEGGKAIYFPAPRGKRRDLEWGPSRPHPAA